MKRQVFSTLMVLAALSPLPALAHNHDHHSRPPAQGEQDMHKQMMEHLELTGDQKQRFEAMHKTYMPEMKRQKEELKAQKEKVQALLTGEKTTRAELKSALDRLTDLEARQAKMQADYLLEMFQLLTPAQRAKFADMYSHQGRHGHHDD